MEEYRKKLEKTPVSRIMRVAYENHILIPAFNIAYLPMIKPIVDVLKELETFGLVEVALLEINRFGAKSFQAVKEKYDLYKDSAFSRLHQDHVPVIDEEGKEVNWKTIIKEVLSLGYDSVMIDGSRLSLRKNIFATQKVVALAHPQGVPVEAEVGSVFGHESSQRLSYEELFERGQGFTSPEDAEYFIQQTNADWLSVAIGNVHGAIAGVAKDLEKVEAQLNIKQLQRINLKTKIPLVLHGGSRINKKYIAEAVKNGITKINIGTEIRQLYEKSIKKSENIEYAQKEVFKKVKELITDYYEIKGSALILAEHL